VLPYAAVEVKRREAMGLKIDTADRHTKQVHGRTTMLDSHCCAPNCPETPYAPAGTRSICKNHFLNFLTWRRRRGTRMFHTYAGMTMEERDTIAAEWMKTVRSEELPATAPKL